MNKFEYKGITYYYDEKDGLFMDSFFLLLDKSISKEVIEYYFSNIYPKPKSPEEFSSFINSLNNNELYSECKNACIEFMESFPSEVEIIRHFLPILFKSFRKIGKPNMVIEYAKKYSNQIYVSSPYLVSLGGACCDMDDYESALKYAKRACAIEKQFSDKLSGELNALYGRIKLHIGPY